MKNSIYVNHIKRILDILISLIGLIILSPVFLIIAVLVRVKMGKGVIFKHQRPGKDGELFYLYKFRSLTNARDANGEFLPDHQRLTSFGKWLRSTSLDEIPELINILKGDMSLVGPRPLEVRYLPYYDSNEMRRHSVMPGLTGLAQVNGRTAIGWEERFAYDLEYVEKISFGLDVKIVLMTIGKVLARADIQDVEDIVDFNVQRQAQIESGEHLLDR